MHLAWTMHGMSVRRMSMVAAGHACTRQMRTAYQWTHAQGCNVSSLRLTCSEVTEMDSPVSDVTCIQAATLRIQAATLRIQTATLRIQAATLRIQAATLRVQAATHASRLQPTRPGCSSKCQRRRIAYDFRACSYTLSCQPCARALPKRLSQNARPRGSAKPDLPSRAKRHRPPLCTA